MVQIITNSNGGGGVGLYKYKGSVDYYEDLPTSGMKVGDTYNVVNAHTTAPEFPAGANLAWNGEEWDVLGGTFDLSEYQKKLVEGDGIDIAQDTNEISVEADVINGAAAGATAVQPGDDVSTLNNDAGYIDNTVSDLVNYTKTCDLANVALSGKYCDLTGTPALCSVATTGSYTDLSNKPTIGNATLTIQKNGTTVNTFGANATTNVTANITVPTCVSELSNDSGYAVASTLCTVATSGKYCDLTGTPALCTVATSGSYNDLSDKPTIPSVINSLTSSCTGEALSAKQGCVLNSCITDINNKIPSTATSSNQLADKCFVNSSINSIAAYFITKNAQGDQFATYAELAAATTFYSGGVVRVPTQNDYTIVASDENHDNATTRYIYQGSQWEYQYTVNETALTQAQLDALNSGITSSKVSCYDGAVTTVNSLCTVATSGKYCDLTGTPSLCTVATSGKYCDLTGLPTIPTNNNQLTNGCGYTTCTGTLVAGDLAPYAKSCDLKTVATSGKYCDLTGTPDLSVYQTTANMVCNLSGADNSHYPTAKAVADALSCAGQGDMLKSVYDPNNKNADAFDYDNFINTPTIPTDNCQLANSCGYITGISCGDVTTALGYTPYDSSNPSGYTTCTGTLTASNISDTAYGSGWNGVTTVAPSKNAVYYKISAMDTTISGKQDILVSGTNIKTVNGESLLGSGNLTIPNYAWVTKTISNDEVEIGIRTLVNKPTGNFTITKPATLVDGEEYTIRIINNASVTITLGTGITNPRNVDLSTSQYATDQLVFLSIGGELELQPISASGTRS